MAFFCHNIKYHKYPLKLISGALLVLLAATLSVGVYTLNLSVFNSYKTADEVLSRRAAAYDAEYVEIINEIIATDWVNDDITQYYDKKGIRLKTE